MFKLKLTRQYQHKKIAIKFKKLTNFVRLGG
jgi:hypothetical protein